MCGISGFANFHRPRSLRGYYEAHSRLRHRGPDDEGFFLETAGQAVLARGDDTIDSLSGLSHIDQFDRASLVLGHRRLSIIDLGPGGHQPMVGAGHKVALTYNGEIYNYRELRAELEAHGDSFETNSDTEVILKSYLRWGQDCFRRFNGMWGLAIWDGRKGGELLLCRDRFGIKPLYYHLGDDGTLFFASEVKFLLGYAISRPAVDDQSAADFLVASLSDHTERTMIAGVSQVQPGPSRPRRRRLSLLCRAAF